MRYAFLLRSPSSPEEGGARGRGRGAPSLGGLQPAPSLSLSRSPGSRLRVRPFKVRRPPFCPLGPSYFLSKVYHPSSLYLCMILKACAAPSAGIKRALEFFGPSLHPLEQFFSFQAGFSCAATSGLSRPGAQSGCSRRWRVPALLEPHIEARVCDGGFVNLSSTPEFLPLLTREGETLGGCCHQFLNTTFPSLV